MVTTMLKFITIVMFAASFLATFAYCGLMSESGYFGKNPVKTIGIAALIMASLLSAAFFLGSVVDQRESVSDGRVVEVSK